MAYQTKYDLEWVSLPPEGRCEWRLDIEQFNYTGSIISLVGGPEPVELEYIDGQDIYDPIIGSKLSINLMVTDDTTYDDFSILHDADGNVDARAYRVNLRVKKGTDTEYSLFWRGFITPQDGDIQDTATPYPMTITATDGMNLVSDQLTVAFDDTDPQNTSRVGEYIFDFVNQTGTQLDIRCYSDLRTDINDTAEYAIIESTCNDYVFFDELFETVKTRTEACESILKAFNACLYQADGVWNIRSNSGHADTINGNEELIPFKTYTYDEDDEEWDDGTETVNENAYVSLPDDFKPVDEDWSVTERRPLFSVECQVSEQNGSPYNENGFFSTEPSSVADTHGPVWVNEGLGHRVDGDTKDYGTTWTAYPDTEANPLGTHYLSTTRTNDTDGSSRRDVWFEVNVPYSGLFGGNDVGKNIVVIGSQDWDDTDIAYATIGLSIVLEYSDNDYFVYEWETNIWDQRKLGHRTAWDRYWTKLETQSDRKGLQNFWRVETAEAQYAVRSFFEAFATFQISGNDLFKIRIGDIKAYDQNGERVDANGKVTTVIDGIMYSDDTGENVDTEPFFERYQDKFSETLQYETDVFSEGSGEYRGKLAQESFYRRDKNEDRTLEQLVTQQKLNDYRTVLKTYEGTIIGQTDGTPLTLNNKLHIDFESDSDDVSAIIRSYTFMPKSNTYNVFAYLPNQATDIGTDDDNFTTDNVFPIVNPYTWRETNISYTYTIDVTGVTLPAGAPSDATIDDYLMLDLPKALDADDNEEVGKYTYQVYGNAGQESEVKILMTTVSGYEINGSNFAIDNLSSLDVTEGAEFVDLGIDISLVLRLDFPDYSEEEELTVSGEIDILSSDEVTFTVTKGTDPTGTTVSVVSALNVPANRTEYVIAYINPTDNTKQIEAANSSLTVAAFDSSDNSLSNIIGTITELSTGFGLQYIIPVSPTTSLDDITFTWGTVTLTDRPSVDTSQVTLNASEAGDDTSNWSLQDTSLGPYTGVVGGTFEAVIEVNADSGFQITNVAVGSTEEAALGTIRTKEITGTEWLVFVELTFQSQDATVAVTIDATTAEVGAEVEQHTISFGSAPSNSTWTLGDSDITRDLVPGSEVDFIFPLEADEGHFFNGTPTLASSQSWASVGNPVLYYNSADRLRLVEFPVTITGQSDSASVTLTPTATVNDNPGQVILESEATLEWGPSYSTNDTFFYRQYRLRLEPKLTSTQLGALSELTDGDTGIVTMSGPTFINGDVSGHSSAVGTLTASNTEKWSTQNSRTQLSDYTRVNIYVRYALYGQGQHSGTDDNPRVTIHHPANGSDTNDDLEIMIPEVQNVASREIVVDNGDVPDADNRTPGALYFEREEV